MLSGYFALLAGVLWNTQAHSLSARCALTLHSEEFLRSQLHRDTQDTIAAHSLPGVSLAVVFPSGRVLTIADGVADRETAATLEPSHRMPGGSIGKTFVAAAAIALAQEGKLNLDAKIAVYMADRPWFGRLPNASEITVRMLMNHTSGIPNHVELPEFEEYVNRELVGHPEKAPTPEQLLSFVFDKPALFPAGTSVHYSDTNYFVIGLLLERLTGRSLYQFVDALFIKPFELNSTTPQISADNTGLAAGYWVKGHENVKVLKGDVMIFNPAIEYGGGGFISTARDLAIWGRHLYEGDALPGAYLDELFQGGLRYPANVEPSFGDRRTRYGAGVYIFYTPLGKVYGHGGSFPGYSSRLDYFADYGFSVAAQTNTDANAVMYDYLLKIGARIAHACDSHAAPGESP